MQLRHLFYVFEGCKVFVGTSVMMIESTMKPHFPTLDDQFPTLDDQFPTLDDPTSSLDYSFSSLDQ